MNKKRLYLFLTVLILLNFGIVGFLGYQNYLLNKEDLVLKQEYEQKKVDTTVEIRDLKTTVALLEGDLGRTKKERDDFEMYYNMEKIRMDEFASQISEIQGTVGILDKLSRTDPELLKKYSKVYFLNENYIPETLVKISPGYTYNSESDYFFYSKVWPFLQELMRAANSENIDIKIISAFRSFGTQSGLKSSYKMIYGSGANQFSADQGYSEHQLGTTIDFTTSKIGATYSGFEKTEAYRWLLNNAYKYGFTLSYPENNEYYQFEPWHWRFVGKSLALRLYDEGKSFYDLNQRDIDQYLVSFFD